MLFPLGDDNTYRRVTPYVVWVMIALNIGVYLLQLAWGDPFTYGYSAIPYELTHNTDLVGASQLAIAGQSVQMRQFPGPVPIYLTVLTAMFMHGSVMHLGGNMLYLWIFGDQIEDLLGHGRFVVFYLLCGLAATAAHVAMDGGSQIPSLGASGAISGVLGAYLVKYPGNPVRVLVGQFITSMPAAVVLGFWIVFQMLSQLTMDPRTSGVAYMAHIGGFVAGLVLVFVFQPADRQPHPGDWP